MINKAIDKAFCIAESRGWDKIYVAVDIHDTIVASNYSKTSISTTFYPMAKKVLQYLSRRKDVVLILYTCSHPEESVLYSKFFESNDIHFDYINCNPEVENHGYGCYDKKIYFNVLIEDKAGFDANVDWEVVFDAFQEYHLRSYSSTE